MRSKWVMGAVVVGALLVMAALGSLGQMPREVQAAAITPVSITHPASPEWIAVEPWGIDVLAADTRSTCYETAKFSVADVQYLIDQGAGPGDTAVNTTTVTIQYTNDQVTFVDGGTVVSANAADASGMVQLGTFGRYSCFYANVTNTSNTTFTVNAVFK
jgi:hypothetical protein